MQKSVETTPVALDKLAPNEILSLDFGVFGDLQILFLKDRYSGYNRYFLTKKSVNQRGSQETDGTLPFVRLASQTR